MLSQFVGTNFISDIDILCVADKKLLCVKFNLTDILMIFFYIFCKINITTQMICKSNISKLIMTGYNL